MTRLIDADKFKDSMKYVCDSGGWLEPVTTAVKDYVVKNIDAQPTVDAVPVRHGVWKKSGEKEWWWYCSNCQEHYFEDDLYINEKHFPKYCPNCGAKMDGEQEKQYFPKGFFSKERPLAKGEEDETD